MTAQDESKRWISGFCSGVVNAGLFNPYDRALYLSVKHKRPFLSGSNFQRPFQGFLQTVVRLSFVLTLLLASQ